MAEAAKQKQGTRVITPEAILSFPRLFVPDSGPQEEGEAPQAEKYSAALVFTTAAQQTPAYAAMKRAAVQAAVNKLGQEKAVEAIRTGKLRMPFRADWEARGYPEGSTFFNARSKQRPGVVANVQDPATGKPRVITEEDQVVGGRFEMYSGSTVIASVNFFYYDRKGNKGIGVGLGNVQRVRDGARLDNRVAAENEFEAGLDEVPASLDGLIGGDIGGDIPF
jgi:hypothetical protein